MTGGAGNDTYTALIDSTNTNANQTFTTLDSLDGGAGDDILNLNVVTETTGALPTVTVSNIETMNIQAADDLGVVGVNDTINDATAVDNDETASVNQDVSGYTGLTTLNITKAIDVSMTAAKTTDVNVTGATGAVEIVQAQNVEVTHATADQSITVGSNVVADNTAGNANTAGDVAGTITVTDTKQGTGNIFVDGGTDVTVTATADKTSGVITVGAVKEATGAVTVTQNTTTDGAAAVIAGDIAVTGGSTIDITANTTATAVKGGGTTAITSGSIVATAGDTTTAVTVNQNNTANNFANDAAAGSVEVSTVTFGALKSGEKVAIHAGTITASTFSTPTTSTDLVFTASKDLTAAEVAAAFSNFISADTQSAGGVVANGTFTGKLDAGWTSDAADGANVTFTATTVGDATSEIAVTAVKADNSTAATNATDFKIASNVDGVDAGSTTAVTIAAATVGDVTIDDNATASITDVTVDGYATLDIGTTDELTKLANLSLANSAGKATVDTAAGITSLNLTVNNVKNDVAISTDSSGIATLNVATTGAASTFKATIADTKNLNVSGDQLLTLNGTSVTTALENVTVTGTAGLNMTAVSVNAAKSITTTGTTGTVTASIDGTAATYTGGAGVDNLTLVTGTALDKAIDLGAGNDTLTFGVAVTGSTATLSGGDGDADTLSMTATNAAALDASAQTFYTNFEHLTINDGGAGETIDLANLGFTDYVTTTGNASALFTDATLTDVTAETFTFTYNGIGYTATLTDADDTTGALTVEDYQNAVDAAVDANSVALGTSKVTATINAGDDAVLTVATAGNSLVGGTHTNDGTTSIAATNTTLTLDKMTTNGTLVLAGSGAVTVQVKDAADATLGTADVLNITANVAATDYSYGTVTVANVETVNITANDTLENDDQDAAGVVTTAEAPEEEATLTLTADTATLVNVYGAADV